MKNLIWNVINWENHKQYIKEKCFLEIEEARISKASMTLSLVIRINFFIADEDLLAAKKIILAQMPELSQVVFTFHYENMLEAVAQNTNGQAEPAEKKYAAKGKTGSQSVRTKKSTKDDKNDPGNIGLSIIGKRISEAAIPIDTLRREMMKAVVEGFVFSKTLREIKNGRTLVSLVISDYTESICVKVFATKEKLYAIEEVVSEGTWIRVHGKIEYDNYESGLVIFASDMEEVEREKRMDDAAQKRVELHAHTKMSAMDGVAEIAELVKTARRWGHEAIAITDHAVVQAFPDASHAAKDIKIIFGMEGYLVDDAPDADGKPADFKSKKTNHIILLAKNQTGLKNLYKLVTLSHMNYFYKRPRIPRSVLKAHREGLIVGGACQDGEVYQSVLAQKPEAELEKVCRFYDYLEVQPIGNNEFLVERGSVESRDGLIGINKRIIEMAKKLDMPVVATSDAHYIEPHEGIYRNILMAGQGYKDVEEGANLFLRTTREMLAEFSYLDEETAQEVVVTNPKKITDMIDKMQPVPREKYPPKMDDAEDELRLMCERRSKEIYGDPLPEIVKERLDRELNSIIGNGYAVMYIIAMRLVKKSLDDGYVVGSRGSVGSSLAATMSGITEVNPLPPHYICPNCKKSEFQPEGGAYGCGVDMPEKDCPDCGTPYKREGFEIPFEVFLGFEGDKEPDIDLNFAGEYQQAAHKYTEQLFGEENVFRAGTIGTIASKTAYGYVMKYCEEKELYKSKWEKDRLVKGCEGVKRTTGQHPGGIIILPKGIDIHKFCPVQYPANDSSSGIKTTHFDYHSIDQNLLKLDILGHDAPSIIRMLKDITGVDPQTVPLQDPKVDSLFLNTTALDFKQEGFKISKGSLGIPEFGTGFVRQMLEDTKPTTFSGLLRISGFSHGTDVWLNNAKDLILSGTARLEEAISVRDDIMNYLIAHGMDKKHSFKIMESVRKGNGITEDDAAAMKSAGVPGWYAESCRRIKYMFPKAHAVAYVIMAYRIAYFKVYYPLAFYAAFFTTKVTDFPAEAIMGGIPAIEKKMGEIAAKEKEATAKELSEVTVMELALEMYYRGYVFMPAALGTSDAIRFKVKDDKVLLPFASLSGVGENAAKALTEEYTKGDFMSVEEMRTRTGLNKTAIEALRTFGVLAGIPETNQLSFF